MKKITLYQLIKKTSQEKGRKLKIVCDWDDCLQPLKPIAIYETSAKSKPFKDFFEDFWSSIAMEGSFSNDSGKITVTEPNKEIKEAVDKWATEVAIMRKSFSDSVYSNPEYIKKRENAPWTSIAENLLEALKEDLIEELWIISSYRGKNINEAKVSGVVGVKKKQEKFLKTFDKFPNCKLELTGVSKEQGKYVPYRWQRMNEIVPDWDIFIDDNPNIVNETIKNVPDPNKIYVLPDYKNCRGVKGDSVYHVETTISKITDQDFATISLKKMERERERESRISAERSIWKQPYIYLAFASGVGISCLGFIIYFLSRRKKSK